MFESGRPSSAAAAAVDRLCAASRAENRAAGERLVAVGELDLLRLREVGERESWATDTHDAVVAEVSAALRISTALASSYLDYSRALRMRLPQVGALLVAGDISYSTFQTIVYRTDLLTDPQVLAGVDAELAVRVARWPSMTRGRLAGYIDRVVARADRDAVRRRHEKQADREFSIWDGGNGLAEVFGRLISTDAHVVDARLNVLADTVCADDPRTRKQRRADALGILAAGADRLPCRCGQADCPAGTAPAPGPVMIHVVATRASLESADPAPGVILGSGELIAADLLADLARSARCRPLVHPADAPAEPGYSPSRELADFVRCQDLTCRFPGCDRPALECDLDHSIPYRDGGPTHASNLKCVCRQHHLIKTFWGWSDEQLPDGTVIWTSPAGQTYVTTPGSALLFPDLCAPTGDLAPSTPTPTRRCAERAVMMPRRRRTRAQNRATYIADQRRRNRQARTLTVDAPGCGPAPPADEPPPF
ncbi:HNH endonuclease signature motif containing protein [Mycobacterium sp.]|uniref:HNH endonuclease signature motif containing protein n=1 Tax=Mycobacterium sp. TaxID=1785 RepID=UPI00127CE77A|nr:HNH endonuclease signature motif containing protein [Mycobacterium sp.]KAA8967032.1 MAG: HNH endonuclease [Mycobacterium sp.]